MMSTDAAKESPPQVVIGRCDCHSKHVARFDAHEKRMDNMQKIFIVTVMLVAGALGWMLVQNNSTAKSITRIETMQMFIVKENDEIKSSLKEIRSKLERHVEDWKKTNGEG